MSRLYAPAAVLLGAVVVLIGALLQISGAAPVVFCSVIGVGIVVAIGGAVTWIVQFTRDRRTPTSLAA